VTHGPLLKPARRLSNNTRSASVNDRGRRR
jgi:hypothetical protein